MDPETENTWKSLVYNVSITPAAVKEFYDGWAGLYDQDQIKLKTGQHFLLISSNPTVYFLFSKIYIFGTTKFSNRIEKVFRGGLS